MELEIEIGDWELGLLFELGIGIEDRILGLEIGDRDSYSFFLFTFAILLLTFYFLLSTFYFLLLTFDF